MQMQDKAEGPSVVQGVASEILQQHLAAAASHEVPS